MTVLTALAPVVWGTTYIVATELRPAGHPMFAALMRALVAGLLALLLSRSLPRGDWWWKALVLGTLNIGMFFPLLFLTGERLPGGVAATLGAIQPIIVAFLAVAILGERLSWCGFALLVPTLTIEGVPERIDAASVGGYLWLGLIGGLLAYTVWFAGIRRVPVTATALLGLLSPLTAATLGVVVLGQVLAPVQLAGFALALSAAARRSAGRAAGSHPPVGRRADRRS